MHAKKYRVLFLRSKKKIPGKVYEKIMYDSYLIEIA